MPSQPDALPTVEPLQFETRERIAAADGAASFLRIQGLNVVLAKNDLDPASDLVVYADTVTIADALAFPGQFVKIVARRIVGGAEASIDVSGAAPDNTSIVKPDPQVSPGADGTNGADGIMGNSAGEIQLFSRMISGPLSLIARGGDGRNGQPGGDARNGADAGDDNRTWCNDRSLALTGRDGQSGGNGGMGGYGGVGGNGGSLRIYAARALEPGTVTTVVSAGAGAVGGAGGSGGGGGRAGAGPMPGRVHVMRSREDTQEICVDEPGRRLIGTAGSPGRDGNGYNTIHARGGYDGNADIGALTAGTSGFDLLFPQVLLELHAAELAYLNREFAGAQEVLTWLAFALDAMTGLASDASVVAADELTAVRQRIDKLLAQIIAGIDYFGNPYDFVPLVSVLSFKTLLAQTLLPNAKTLEETFDTFSTTAKGTAARLKALDDARAAATAVLTALSAEQKELVKEADRLNAVITDLGNDLDHQRAALFGLGPIFENAVKSHGLGCTLSECIIFASAVIALASGTVAALGAVSHEIGDLVTHAETYARIVHNVEIVENSAPQISAALDTLRRLQSNPGVDPNALKIGMTIKDFDAAMEPYLEIPEALQYRDAMHLFTGTAQTLNAKLLEFTGVTTRLSQLADLLRQKKGELERLTTQRTLSVDPDTAAYASFVQTMLVSAKACIIRTIYWRQRAFMYWSLDETPFPAIGDFRVAELDTAASRIEDRIVAIAGSIGRGTENLPTREVVLTAAALPFAFDVFARTGILRFAIPTDHPAFIGQALTKVRAVALSIAGLRGVQSSASKPAEAVVELVHHGNTRIRDVDGEWHHFAHAPRPTLIYLPLESGTSIVESLEGDSEVDVTFLRLSPFAIWTIEVRPQENPALDLTGVTLMSLAFKTDAVALDVGLHT
jgi:hypothetical protein